MTVSISKINAFCRKNDLVFVETGANASQEIFWFLDYTNHRRSYTQEEITLNLKDCESRGNTSVS